MADVFLVITTPDYEGFSVIEAHLSRGPADARAAAANDYSDKAPAFPRDDDEADYDRWHAEHEAWCRAHPFGYEKANGYVQQRYSVIEVPIGPLWRGGPGRAAQLEGAFGRGPFHVERRTNACAEICDEHRKAVAECSWSLLAGDRADAICALLNDALGVSETTDGAQQARNGGANG